MSTRMYRVEYGFLAGRLCTLVHTSAALITMHSASETEALSRGSRCCPLSQADCHVALSVKLNVDDKFVIGREVIVGEIGCGFLDVGSVPQHPQHQVVEDVCHAVSWQPHGTEGTQGVLALHQQFPAHRAQSWQ